MVTTNTMLTSILESIGQPAIIFRDNQILAANDDFVDLIGCAVDELYQRKLLKLIYPSSRRVALHYFRDILKNPGANQSISLRLCPSADKPCWGNIIVKPAHYAGNGCYLALVRNITDDIQSPTVNYPAIIEHLPIGIYRTTRQGKILYANQTFAEMLGFQNVDELKQHNIQKFYMSPHERQTIIDTWDDEQGFYERDLRWVTHHGDIIWVKIVGQIIRDSASQILCMQGSIQDYTKQKHQEVDLQNRHHELEILHNITRDLGKSLNLEQTLQTVLEQMRQVVPFISASIFLLNNGQVDLIAEQGYMKYNKNERLARSNNFFAIKHFDIFEKESTIIIPDVLEEPEWIHTGETNIRSWMGVGLRYKDEVIGILNLDHDAVDFYTLDHVRYAEAVAGQAAIAIANAQYYQQAQDEIKRRREAQDILIHNLINTETIYWVLRHLFTAERLEDVLPSVIEMLSAALEHTEFFLVVFEPDSGELRYKLKSQDASFDTWEMFTSIAKQPKLADGKMPSKDFKWIDGYTYEFPDGRKALAATVWQRGMLAAVCRDATIKDFTEANIELLVTVANQLTVALENEEYTNRLRNRSEHFQRLADRRSQQLSVELKSQRALLDATAEGIFYMENFRMHYANPAFCQMVGYSIEELYGKPFSYLRVSNDEAEQLVFNDLLYDQTLIEPGRSETRLRHKDGTEFYASIRFSMVDEPGNDVMRMVAIARDITQERELYFQRARFIANAAHELRNPLSRLILRTHMMKRQPENAVKHLDKLDGVVETLKQIVEELLDLSRFERGTVTLERSDIDLQSVLQDVVKAHQDFAEQQGVTVNLAMPPQPIFMQGDVERIKQLFRHLFVNGLNYTEADGKLDVQVYREQDHLGNQNVMIEFADDGIGIDADLLPSQIFEPFVRPSEGTRRETGMGLALAREIVQLHGGTIHARSAEGDGSIFRVSLPIN